MGETQQTKIRSYGVPVALATGMLVSLLLYFLGFDKLSPELWNDVSAAAGLRPPTVSTGGLARGLYLLFFRHLAPNDALFAVRVAGWVGGVLIGFLGCSVLSGFCGGWVDRFSARARERAMVTVALVTATLAFVTSDAVWYALQGLSATSIQLILALAGTRFLQLFVKTCRRRYTFPAMFCWALLAADQPVCLLGVVAVGLVVFFVNRRRTDGLLQERLRNPLVRIVLQRGLFGVFVLTFVTGVIAMVGPLQTLGGFAGMADGEPRVPGIFGYLSDGFHAFLAMSSWKLWILAFIVIIAPLVVTRILRDRSINDEDFLPVKTICLHLLFGLAAWTQVGGVRLLRFDNWLEAGTAAVPLLGALFAFAASLTLLWSMLILGAAVFLKSPHTTAGFRYADASESADGERSLAILDRVRRWAVPATALVPVILVGLMIGLRREPTLQRMLAVIDAALGETVAECAGATRVFTDGKLDAGLELEAFRRGGSLYTVSILSGVSARDLALRNRGLTDEGDLRNSSVGAMNLLRTWVNDSPTRLADAASQIAFELWLRRPDQPTYLGLVARPALSVSPAAAEVAVRRAHELTEQTLAVYAEGNPDRSGTRALREAFRAVQWRLARLATMRAKVAGRDNWGEDAAHEQDFADRLNACNSAYATLNRAQSRLESSGPILTPREGLRLGLDRADFKLASVFAERVLLSAPNDPQANFALGMHYFLAEDHSRAEPYLRRCLESRPDDPAVLNNLAVVELRLCRYDEAERHAAEAQALLPNSTQIQRTVEAIRKARGEQQEPPK